jgi:hypothetical protein
MTQATTTRRHELIIAAIMGALVLTTLALWLTWHLGGGRLLEECEDLHMTACELKAVPKD